MLSDKPLTYNPWPMIHDPELMRPELNQLKQAGYEFGDAREVVKLFEDKVAKFCGSEFAVAVDCASNGLFLCLKFLKAEGQIIIPENTYVSVPQQIKHAGCDVILYPLKWSGVYQLHPYNVYDGAVRWKRDCYQEFKDSLYVISFQIKKRIPTGKMGVILCDKKYEYKALKLMSYDGRDLNVPYNDPKHVTRIGYHMYATPEDCARTILLMDKITTEGDSGGDWSYPNLKQWEHVWK